MKNCVIKVPDSDIWIMLANGSGSRDVPILLTRRNVCFLGSEVDGTFYIDRKRDSVAYAYVAKSVNGKRIITPMHKILTGCTENEVADHHPNHYGLDNRFSIVPSLNNLTVVSPLSNAQNQLVRNRRPVFFEKLTDPDSAEALIRDIEVIKTLNLKL